MYILYIFTVKIIKIKKVVVIWLLSEKIETLENDFQSFLKQIITKYIYIYIYIRVIVSTSSNASTITQVLVPKSDNNNNNNNNNIY